MVQVHLGPLIVPLLKAGMDSQDASHPVLGSQNPNEIRTRHAGIPAGSAQYVLVVQQDAAVIIECHHVVAAPGDGPVSDGDHPPSQPDESGC
jgi:hypothetical protein